MKRVSETTAKQLKVWYPKDSVFASNARLLQSLWRVENIGANIIGRDDRGYNEWGNMLPVEFAKETGANYLSDGIMNVVQKTIKEGKATGALIAEPRIWNNLLSSQPLAFNIFGELCYDLEFARDVFQFVIPKIISKITSVRFEYSPGRMDSRFTNDKTAFDVFVEYLTADKEKGFIGIEVKYSENMDENTSSIKPEYWEITKKSEIFNPQKHSLLAVKPFEQLWRNHLLALSMYKVNPMYDEGYFMFLYPKDNIQCEEASRNYLNCISASDIQSSGYLTFQIEELLNHMMYISDAPWIRRVYDRYFNFEKLNLLT